MKHKWGAILESNKEIMDFANQVLQRNEFELGKLGDEFAIYSPKFEELADPSEIGILAREWANRINLVLKFYRKRIGEIKYRNVFYLNQDGTRQYFATLNVKVEGKPSLSNAFLSGNRVITEPPITQPMLFEIMVRDERVGKALKFIEESDNPHLDFYKVVEALQGRSFNRVVSKNKDAHAKLQKFCNNPDVGGDKARHFLRNVMQSQIPSIGKFEAQEILRRFLKEWLEFEHGIYL